MRKGAWNLESGSLFIYSSNFGIPPNDLFIFEEGSSLQMKILMSFNNLLSFHSVCLVSSLSSLLMGYFSMKGVKINGQLNISNQIF
jgi:hypothetical protein